MATTIAVFGAGAVGSFFGGLLARAGQDVRFIARGAQLEALRRHGLEIQSTLFGTIHVSDLHVAARAEDVGPVDLVLLCVKAHQTAGVLDALTPLVTARSMIVTLQNGVESDEIVAARFGRIRVIPAVVYVGATLEQPGRVSHVAAGTIALGSPVWIARSVVDGVRDVLATSGQSVRISDDIQRERWRKLLWNASFNTVSAVTSRDPGALLQVPETRQLITSLMKEVAAVARAEGVALADRDVEDQIVWTEQAGSIRTSTTVDRERGREMEIDALIGVVVRRGKQHGVPTPTSDVMLALLRGVADRPATSTML
jgi:2-dehydropantoate 2-reductase